MSQGGSHRKSWISIKYITWTFLNSVISPMVWSPIHMSSITCRNYWSSRISDHSFHHFHVNLTRIRSKIKVIKEPDCERGEKSWRANFRLSRVACVLEMRSKDFFPFLHCRCLFCTKMMWVGVMHFVYFIGLLGTVQRNHRKAMERKNRPVR